MMKCTAANGPVIVVDRSILIPQFAVDISIERGRLSGRKTPKNRDILTGEK